LTVRRWEPVNATSKVPVTVAPEVGEVIVIAVFADGTEEGGVEEADAT
jgi:hypothetical protein